MALSIMPMPRQKAIKQVQQMEFLPSEIIENEFLLNLSPNDLINYCAINKQLSKICKSRRFWNLKVSATPRRELQNDWFLYFAKLGETALLWNLYTTIENQGVILDDRAITYAALYLLEQEDKLSPDGNALLESFLLITEYDQALKKELYYVSVSNLRDWLIIQRTNINHVREEMKQGKLATYNLLGDYLHDFIVSYMYNQLVDVLPPLSKYLNKLARLLSQHGKQSTVEEIEISRFTSLLLPLEVRSGNIDTVKSLLEYAASVPLLMGWHSRAIAEIIAEVPYKEAKILVPQENYWRQLGILASSTTLDPDSYYEIVGKEHKVYALSYAWRSLEPEEFISYLHQLVTEKEINRNTMIKALENALSYAKHYGYSYFAIKVNKKLEELKNKAAYA